MIVLLDFERRVCMAILIDKRIQRFVEGYLLGENDETISIRLKDIDETFWFENEVDA